MTVLRSSNIQSWGRVINEDHFVYSPFRRKDAAVSFDNARANGLTCIASGLRRSYGDTCLNPHNLIVNMCGIDRFMQFDASSGVLRAEAGTSLGEIMQAMVPRGYFLHTTPGTRFVTLGGAIANDVHGKNQHSAGSFGENVLGFGLLRSDHEHEIHVTAETEPELYRATIGGLGLTGIISWVDLQLVSIPSAMIRQEITPFDNLDDFFDVSKDALTRFEHTVAWVDCTATGDNLGRGIFTGGNWAKKGELKSHASGGPNVPFDAPGFALNPLTLKSFNTVYNWRQKSKRTLSSVHYSAHFHPLDSVQNWNKIYGKNGFYQYQSVIPMKDGKAATREMLKIIARSGQGSMLAVLKTMGPLPGKGVMSFPMEGVTLALDFQNLGQKTIDLMNKLDDIVKSAGGRLYPAKDGRMTADIFQFGYPDWKAVEKLRDPLITSRFWQRVTNV